MRTSTVIANAVIFLALGAFWACADTPSALSGPDGDPIGYLAADPGSGAVGLIGFTMGPWGFGSDIAVVSADGTGLTNLTNSEAPEMMGGWSADGANILFTRGASPTEFQIWSMAADGSNQLQLTSGPGVRLAPTFAPDGRILYMRSSDLSGFDADLFVAEADGSSPVNLTNHPSSDGCGRFSPDGSKILFSSTRATGTPDIFVMNADGSGVQQLTSSRGIELCPSWSPDGNSITYGQIGGGNPGIYVANADGSGAVKIHGHGFAAQPWWSPDGEWITFHRYHGGALDVYIVRPDGSERFLVTDLKEHALNPIWSP